MPYSFTGLFILFYFKKINEAIVIYISFYFEFVIKNNSL